MTGSVASGVTNDVTGYTRPHTYATGWDVAIYGSLKASGSGEGVAH